MASRMALQSYVVRIQDIRREIEGNGAGPGIWSATARFLKSVQHRLVRPPRIAIIGESNTGKTSLANRLLGHELLITDIINNTRAPILIRHADVAGLSTIAADGTREPISHDTVGALGAGDFTSLELGLPLPALRRFEIIDTPGVSVLGDNRDRLAFVCRQADLAIWCTLATQAWRASERELWLGAGERLRSSSLLAVTHADALTEFERARVGERLRREAAPLFFDIAMVALAESPSTVAATANGDAAHDPLIAAFRGKIDAALVKVEERRLNGARRAVQRFELRLDGPGPIGHLQTAS